MSIIDLKKPKVAKEYVIEVVIEPDEDVYHAYCPILRGCHSWGHTEEEAFRFIQEAVRLHLEDMIDDGEIVPGVGIVDSINHLNLVLKVRDTENIKVSVG